MYHRVTNHNLQSTWEIVGLRGRSVSSLPSITEIRDITKRSDSNHLKTGICYTKSSKISKPFIFSDLSQYAVVRHKLLYYHNYAPYNISKHTRIIVSFNSIISLIYVLDAVQSCILYRSQLCEQNDNMTHIQRCQRISNFTWGLVLLYEKPQKT